ncbi:MAG: hypothetical protein KJ042_02365 [Deltaproteobacteria bacterium]|nr:hypothetical protein [Deltaproteobacteria bacterium]
MERIAEALVKRYLASQGYLAAFGVNVTAPAAGGPTTRGFDVVGLRIRSGSLAEAVVGVIRAWWNPGAHLTPSMLRSHLMAGVSEALSDVAVDALRIGYGLSPAVIRKVLFYSQASPEKSEEAEAMLAKYGIETVYLDREAASLARDSWPSEVPGDASIAMIRAFVRGAWREGSGGADLREAEVKPVAEPPTPQLSLALFGERAPGAGGAED